MKRSKFYGISYTERGRRVVYHPNQNYHAAKVDAELRKLKARGYKNPRKFKIF